MDNREANIAAYAFSELAEAELPLTLKSEVDKLLYLKMNYPEIKEIEKIQTVNDYLDVQIPQIKDVISALPDDEYSHWDELNRLFLSQI